MSEISVSREELEIRFGKVADRVDDLDRSLNRVPDAPDGGIATELISFAMAAAMDGAATTADGYRALIAVATDVLDDFASNEDRAVAELVNLKDGVEGEG